jgi:hypothetical protein
VLEALLHNKIGRARAALDDNDPDEDTSRSRDEGITEREDPLTATVFGRLAYLDTGILWGLLREACDASPGSPLPDVPPAGAPEWLFWPRLSVGEHGRNTRHVEPDVVIAWDAEVILVEAKHRGPQRADQWVEEISALRSSARFSGRRLWLMAAGGTNPDAHEARIQAVLSKLPEHAPACLMLRWERLRSAVSWAATTASSSSTSAILRDLAAALDAWGYRQRFGFETLAEVARRVRFRSSANDLNTWKTR